MQVPGSRWSCALLCVIGSAACDGGSAPADAASGVDAMGPPGGDGTPFAFSGTLVTVTLKILGFRSRGTSTPPPTPSTAAPPSRPSKRPRREGCPAIATR